MFKNRISRRTMIKGVLGSSLITLGLPPLEIWMNQHGTAFADESPFPSRFGLFFWGNGVIPNLWNPIGDGPEWALSEQLAPLADVKDWLSVLTGLNVQVPNNYPHMSGPAGLLSGQGQIGDDDDIVGFRSISVDQIMAQSIGHQTRFPSIEFGAQPGKGLSFVNQNTRNPPESSPYALFRRLFGVGFRAPGDDSEIDPTIGYRRSVLDAVLSQVNDLKSKVSTYDRQRLDQHFEGIRSLEMRLARLADNPVQFDACTLPNEPQAIYPDVEGRPPMREINQVFSELIALSLACDQTRVFSNWFTATTNNILFAQASAGHHQLTHDEAGEQPQVHAIVLQIMECFADMLHTLKSIPEGNGTLLDHSIILGTTDCSLGRTHSIQNYPLLLAGSNHGKFKQGIHYHSRIGENTSQLMLSLMRSMGVRIDSFGIDNAYATENLSSIET